MKTRQVISILCGIVHAIERMNVQYIENAPTADWVGAYKEAIRCVMLVHRSEKV